MTDVTATTVLAYIPSPSQGVWHLGPVPIRAYALFIILGIVIAVWWGSARWRARGGQEGEVLDVAIWAVPFGLVGGRLYHLITDWPTYFGSDATKSPVDALKIWEGGLGIWGAVALGAVGAWLGCRQRGIKLGPFGDAIAPAILLAQAVGRIGNYFNQELFGGVTTLPWGLEIFDRQNSFGQVGPNVIDGASTGHVTSGLFPAVHPTFLYELLWNVVVVLILVVVDRYSRIGHGRLFALYVAGYCVGRFGIELMRTDHASLLLGIRVNVFTAVVVFAAAAMYFVLARKGRERGLTMYQPWRAEELAEEGAVGYIDPFGEDEFESAADEHAEPETSSGVPDDVDRVISASRDIAAPVATIFELIADPAQQPRWDGNDNLNEAAPGQRVRKVGDVFEMTLNSGPVRRNHIVEFNEPTLIAWLPSEVGGTPPGHLWRWELSPIDDANTRVTHTYDWTRLADEKRLVRARSMTPTKLDASIIRLAEIAEQTALDEQGAAADVEDLADEPTAITVDEAAATPSAASAWIEPEQAADAEPADAEIPEADEPEADEPGADEPGADEPEAEVEAEAAVVETEAAVTEADVELEADGEPDVPAEPTNVVKQTSNVVKRSDAAPPSEEPATEEPANDVAADSDSDDGHSDDSEPEVSDSDDGDSGSST